MSSKTLMIKIIIILHDVSSQNINKHPGGREIVKQEKKKTLKMENLQRGENLGRSPPTVYLASPMGFSPSAYEVVLPMIVSKIESLGVKIHEPFKANAQNGLGPSRGNELWALDVARADVEAVRQTDAIFAVINGTPPDEGVAVEIGVAIALGKPTFLFRDDYRRCCDSNTFACNLMLYAGLPMEGWESYLYSSIDEITDPEKALAKWVRKQL